MKATTWVLLIVLVGLLCACGSSAAVNKTKINIEFPFEPGFPGYIVDISSKHYTANLMCSLSEKGGPGEVLDIDAEDHEKSLGICDTKSITLNVGINDTITVTAILGGFPFVNELTQSPSRIVDISDAKTCPNCKQAEFDFKPGGFPK